MDEAKGIEPPLGKQFFQPVFIKEAHPVDGMIYKEHKQDSTRRTVYGRRNLDTAEKVIKRLGPPLVVKPQGEPR